MHLRLVVRLVMALLAVAASLSPANAGGWQDGMYSRVRMIAAGRVDAEALAGRTRLSGPLLLAGVEIRLDPGWKTYWRTPGDGIPPQFDWSDAGNVAATQVLWPAPRHFRDAAGAYNGYKDRVIFPVVIAPKSSGQPVALKLKLDYAVCKDICVPASAELSLRLDGAESGAREAVFDWVRRTPVRADAQGRCGAALAFDEINMQRNAPEPYLTVAVAHLPGTAPEDLFAEAATGQFIPRPERLEGDTDGRTVFRVDLGTGSEADALTGEAITFTAVAAPRSCEMVWTVK